MPRYSFRVTDGTQVLKPKGLDLPGNAAARALKHGKQMPGRSWSGWFVRIVDQHGHEVDAIAIADVPDAP